MSHKNISKINKLIFTGIFLSMALVFAYTCSASTVACSFNGDCGTNSYIGSPLCQGSNIYQNYITYTCNNAGSANSYCSNSKVFQLKNTSDASCENNTYDSVSVQTNPATSVLNNQLILNGSLSGDSSVSCSAEVWFQYGKNTSYGLETVHQTQDSSGLFNQNINNDAGNIYHFRAVAESCSGKLAYGQDIAVNPAVTNTSSLAASASPTSLAISNNNISATSYVVGAQPASVPVVITSGQVLGASTVSTGLTNNFWVDSFFLPLLITIIGVWMLRSGIFFGVEKWIDGKKKQHRGYKSEKELDSRIARIRRERGI